MLLVTVLVSGEALAARGKPEADLREGLRGWVIQAEGDARVAVRAGVMDIDSPKGVTIWWRQPLRGPVTIEYEVRAVSAGGPNDGVSDANAFWMATDPAMPGGSALARPRSGAFADYDTLLTYYVGIGGNRNTTTRFRRYTGRAGDRPLLPQHDRKDAAALLQPGRWTHLRLVADGHRIAVERDGAPLFTLDDPAPYARGHFGLRTTQSHLQVRNLRIVRP